MNRSKNTQPHAQPAAVAALPSPKPAAGTETYDRERALALAFSVRRLENYTRWQASSRRGARVDYWPIKLDVENVSRCNFRCAMCALHGGSGGRRAADMLVEEFKRLMDEQYGLVEIKLQGLGEPTLQGDALCEMIRYARAQSIWVRTATNASLLHLGDCYKKLIDADVNEIQISVDGADSKIFESIRRGGRFERVCANCRLINAYCRERGVERTKMWTVVQRENEHQMEALVRLASDLGFTSQVFSLDMHGWGVPGLEERNAARRATSGVDHNRMLALVELGAGLGVKVQFWVVGSKYSTESVERLCPWPFERAYVSSDMRTVPCCIIGNPDVFELGRGMRFAEAWHSEAYAHFRQAHLDGNIPDVCRACYVDGPREAVGHKAPPEKKVSPAQGRVPGEPRRRNKP